MRSGAEWCAKPARPSIRHRLLACFAALAVAGAAGAQDAADEKTVPSFAELEAAGARIGEIRVIAEDIFDLNDPKENNWLFRLANKLHIATRPEVIRRLLLFEKGDRVTVQAIEETERLLRAKHYLYEVSIRPLSYEDGVADIEVRTRDTWSLDLGIGISREGGENKGRFSVKEDNIAGTGITFGIAYTSDVDRKGVEFNVADTNVFGTRGVVAYSYADYNDGNSQSFTLQRPFYALDARWAAGIAAAEYDQLTPQYNAGNVIAEYRVRSKSSEAFGGWSPGLISGWTTRYSAGVLYDDKDYELEPGKAPPTRLPSDLILAGPFLRFEVVEDAFRTDVNLNLIGRVEDFAMGVQAKLQLGRALADWGSTRDAWLYDLSVTNGFDITRDSFLQANLRTAGRYSEEGGENQSVGAAVRYYYRFGRRFVYYAALSADAVYNPDIPGPLEIGGDNGLRGYPLRYQAGEKRVLFTTEARGYTDWYPFRLFRVGGAVFYDVGRAWEGENQNTVNPGWLHDVGFGLRLLSARTSKGNVFHADVAFPLVRDPSIDSVQILFKTKVAF
jgi:outer membrane protein assembly factor BamA